MRVFTYQHKNALSVLDTGVWKSSRKYNAKVIDCMSVKDSYPIYTYVTTIDATPTYPISLSKFYYNIHHYIRNLSFDLSDVVQVELDIPDDFIINMKDVNNKYLVVCSEDDPYCATCIIEGNEKRYYKYPEVLNDYYTKDFTQVVHSNDDVCFEAVIPEIRKEHVVAIREFQINTQSKIIECRPLYLNQSLHPLWYDTIYIGDIVNRVFLDERTNSNIVEKVKVLSRKNKYLDVAEVVQGFLGAKSLPDYFTIDDAKRCADSSLLGTIECKIVDKGVKFFERNKFTLGDLLSPDPLPRISYKTVIKNPKVGNRAILWTSKAFNDAIDSVKLKFDKIMPKGSLKLNLYEEALDATFLAKFRDVCTQHDCSYAYSFCEHNMLCCIYFLYRLQKDVTQAKALSDYLKCIGMNKDDAARYGKQLCVFEYICLCDNPLIDPDDATVTMHNACYWKWEDIITSDDAFLDYNNVMSFGLPRVCDTSSAQSIHHSIYDALDAVKYNCADELRRCVLYEQPFEYVLNVCKIIYAWDDAAVYDAIKYLYDTYKVEGDALARTMTTLLLKYKSF